jgi:hypothetical protein
MREDTNRVNSGNQSITAYDAVEPITSEVCGYQRWEEVDRNQILCGRYSHIIHNDVKRECVKCGAHENAKGVIESSTLLRDQCVHRMIDVTDRCTLCHARRLK